MKPEYKELVLMLDVLCAAIETKILPAIGSPCHRLARKLVSDSGVRYKRKRLRLNPTSNINVNPTINPHPTNR
jgi:hypothetical protein